jgi:hypothetical protein
LVLDPPRVEVVVNEPVKTNRSNPFGTARPREDVLAEKGLDWKKLEMEMEAKKNSSLQSSRPTSAHSSRPSSAQSNRSEGPGLLHQGFENVAAKPRPRVNPFGEAKPRELLLQERGQDWIKIDRELEHRGVDRYVLWHYLCCVHTLCAWFSWNCLFMCVYLLGLLHIVNSRMLLLSYLASNCFFLLWIFLLGFICCGIYNMLAIS